jgi:glycosyltransferase involved in cell wall biosynthesis
MQFQQVNNKNINIGLNGSMLDEHPTGVGVYSINIINHLCALYQKETHRKITVFSPSTTFLNKNIKVVVLSKFLRSSQYGKIAAFCRFVWNTFYYPLKVKKFDLLISTTTHGSFVLKNQIITIHDLLSLRFNNISPHQRFYFKYLLPWLVSNVKLIIAVSETTKKDIIHYLKCPAEKIKVVYNGYNELFYNIDNNVNSKKIQNQYGIKNYFLAVGPTYPHKNFELLIDAYCKLDSNIKHLFPLVIAGGKNKYLNLLKLYVSQKNVESNIHFVGYVPEALMPDLYKEAYALVFPSLYEGFGFPLLEAMACGCPVIASHISSMPEVCEDAALYFNPYNTESLTVQLQSIITDKNLYYSLKEKGLNQAKKFSWNKTVDQLKNIIEEVIHSPLNTNP